MVKDLDELLPKKIKVGYSYYSIEIQDDKWMDENGATGDQHGGKKVINICDSWEWETILDTLTHEIFHAIWEFMNLPSKAKEEPVVHCLATGWTMVLHDNPDLKRVFYG